MRESSWRPPNWMYRECKPPGDDAYFENMTRVIFLAGLGWKMIDSKWENFRKAFVNFAVDKVARFGDSDLAQLMADKGIVRNKQKIEAAIYNASIFQKIRKEWGDFQSYLDSFEKSQNYALAIKELGKKFKRLGPSSIRLFLYSVGEKIRHSDE